MKDIIKILIITMLLILAFILQIYIFNDLTLFGIKANLLLVLTVALAIWVKPNITIPFTFAIGLFSDLVFSYTIGKGLVTYIIIMALIMLTLKLCNKQNIGVAILIMLMSTIVCEYMFWIFDGIKNMNFQNVFSVLLLALKEGVINMVFGFSSFKLFKKLS